MKNSFMNGKLAGRLMMGYLFACVYGSRMLEVGNPRVACGIACAIAAVISQVGDLRQPLALR